MVNVHGMHMAPWVKRAPARPGTRESRRGTRDVRELFTRSFAREMVSYVAVGVLSWLLLKVTVNPIARRAVGFTFWANLVIFALNVAIVAVHGVLDLGLWRVRWRARREWRSKFPNDPVPF